MSRPPARRRLLWLLACLAAALGAPAARALDPPAGRIVLSVTGEVARRNAGEGADFDLAMLERLPQKSLTTATPWYPSPRRFTGVLLRDLLAAAGARGTTARAIALNDYQVDIPLADAERHDVLIAWLLDGQPMAVRDKGPLVVMYPFDSHPELRDAVHYGRAAWQLRRLDIR